MNSVFKMSGLAMLVFGNWLTVCAQDAPGTTNTAAAIPPQPRAVFSETLFDFGRVRNTEEQNHVFVVTNAGDATLEITAIRPGCGCTMAGEWTRQVPPGQTGQIPVKFNPATFNGHVSKAITVICNDPSKPTHYLQFQATVVRPFEVQPQYVSFQPIQGDHTVEPKSVRIINNLEEDASLELPVVAGSKFKTELKAIRPGKEFELVITPAVSPGSETVQESLAVRPVEGPPLNVTAIMLPVQPALVAMPDSVVLPAEPPVSRGRVQTVLIRNNSKDTVTMSEPSANVESVTVQIQETLPNKLFTLNVTFPPDFKLPQDRQAEVAVHTSHPNQPIIKLPISQMSPPPQAAAPPSPASAP